MAVYILRKSQCCNGGPEHTLIPPLYRSGNGESGNSNPLALMGHLVVPKQQQLGLLSAQCSLCTVLSLQHCSDSCVSKCTAEMCCLQCLCEIQLLKTVLEVNTFERQNYVWLISTYLVITHVIHVEGLFYRI